MNETFHLHITREWLDRLTADDMECLENAMDGKIRVGRLKDIIAYFCVTEGGQPIPEREAKRLLGALSLTTGFMEMAKQFVQQIQDLAVNPPSAAA